MTLVSEVPEKGKEKNEQRSLRAKNQKQVEEMRGSYSEINDWSMVTDHWTDVRGVEGEGRSEVLWEEEPLPRAGAGMDVANNIANPA